MRKPHLLALAASYRHDSLNRELLTRSVELAEQHGANTTTLDYGLCDAPLYKGNAQAKLPKGASLLADAVLSHDGILLASPEYNWSIPGSLKNLIDWLSIDERAPLSGKTALLMCASPSSRGGVSGLQQLRVPLEVLGVWVYPQLIGIGQAKEQFKPEGLARKKDQDFLSNSIADFVRATAALTRKRHA